MSQTLKGAVLLGTGFCIGYYFAFKKLKEINDDILADEVEAAKAFYKNLYKVDMEAYEKLRDGVDDILEEAKENSVDEDHDEPIYQSSEELQAAIQDGSAFENHDEEIVGEAVKAMVNYGAISTPVKATPTVTQEQAVSEPENTDTPYLIDFHTFDVMDDNMEKISVNWYEGDQVMENESGETESEAWIGSHIGYGNLTKFGTNPDDPNIIYVRSVKFGTDYEVCRFEGTYAEEVQGLAG